MPLYPPRRFQTAKAGNRPDECEDASRVVYSVHADEARIALCDGASESAFARSWAQILVDAFVRRPLDLSELSGPALTGWLGPCEKKWSQTVPWERIPWHGEAKTRAGALAALLALTIDLRPNSSGGFPWQAAAVGDCCLFVVRDGDLQLAFPMDFRQPVQQHPFPHLQQPCQQPEIVGAGWATAGGVPLRGCSYPLLRRAGCLAS